MLEEWVRDTGVLQSFAREVKTGQPIPEAMVKQLRIAEEFGKGLEVRRQMYLAALSLHLHDREPRGLDSTALVAEFMPQVLDRSPTCRTRYLQAAFGHLNGYSAVYYTYMWSLVIAKDLFTPFAKDGVFDREIAARYRRADSGAGRRKARRNPGLRFPRAPVRLQGLRGVAGEGRFLHPQGVTRPGPRSGITAVIGRRRPGIGGGRKGEVPRESRGPSQPGMTLGAPAFVPSQCTE